MLQAKWSIQDCKFHSDLKVLDLQNCDMVIGIEWLERFSPMKVHWAQKWLTIPYHKSQVTLQGILPGVIVYNMVELLHLATESQPEESQVTLGSEVANHTLSQIPSNIARHTAWGNCLQYGGAITSGNRVPTRGIRSYS
jgi:hypothetical protein